MSQSIHRLLDACQTIVAAIERATQNHHGPILIAIDGGSGAGKSTLAAQLERQIDAVVVPLDDFFAAHIADWEWDTRSVAQRAQDVFEWQRLRAQAQPEHHRTVSLGRVIDALISGMLTLRPERACRGACVMATLTIHQATPDDANELARMLDCSTTWTPRLNRSPGACWPARMC
jgi:hypothetical protein